MKQEIKNATAEKVKVGDRIWAYHCEIGETNYTVLEIGDLSFYCQDDNGNTCDIDFYDVYEIQNNNQ